MSSFSYGLAMTSVMDSEEDLSVFEAPKESSGSQCKRYRRSLPDGAGLIRARAKRSWNIMRQWKKRKNAVLLIRAEGRIAASSVAIYPGVPLIVPGERIDQERIDLLNLAQKQGLTITGLMDHGLFVVI